MESRTEGIPSVRAEACKVSLFMGYLEPQGSGSKTCCSWHSSGAFSRLAKKQGLFKAATVIVMDSRVIFGMNTGFYTGSTLWPMLKYPCRIHAPGS